ncbi:hypothetical protein AZE42_05668 [Rhizopogon vesiculosus]|uniref:Uncharacterized protein n=1 Tax=Rhizopogon vesiculosus TaxID=180088 RepID=A0A1J8R0X6_9AGAM|nr:hypothetical protein AZE42_05668 [Rhizopogon vesiculosus]
MYSDPIQRRRPALREHDRLPQGFFDSAPDNVYSSSTRRRHALSPSSTLHPPKFLSRFFSLFHPPQPTTGESMDLQQSQRSSISSHPGPRAVEVATVRDKETLFVARRPEQTSDNVQRITNPTWWTRILFLCCVSVPSADTNGRQ